MSVDVQETLVRAALDNLKRALAFEDERRSEHTHLQAQVQSAYQSLRDAQDKTERARAALEKLLGKGSP